MKRIDITLSTDHPSSSHGLPVAIIDGQAYGPDDIYNGLPVASYIIVNIDPERADHEDMMRFLSQSPKAHARALAAVERLKSASESD
ncbi:MAG TPA: hypothetical protein DCZ95_03780 [Verrucomicrobia bacterium]|nr:hypothetical protein [Verrucomicrobiota bacterium]